MKQLSIFIATLVLTCFAFVPAVARADDMDDLDVTMDVFDDIASIDGDIAMMEGPDDDELDDAEDDMDDDLDDDSDDDGEYGESDTLGARWLCEGRSDYVEMDLEAYALCVSAGR